MDALSLMDNSSPESVPGAFQNLYTVQQHRQQIPAPHTSQSNPRQQHANPLIPPGTYLQPPPPLPRFLPNEQQASINRRHDGGFSTVNEAHNALGVLLTGPGYGHSIQRAPNHHFQAQPDPHHGRQNQIHAHQPQLPGHARAPTLLDTALQSNTRLQPLPPRAATQAAPLQTPHPGPQTTPSQINPNAADHPSLFDAVILATTERALAPMHTALEEARALTIGNFRNAMQTMHQEFWKLISAERTENDKLRVSIATTADELRLCKEKLGSRPDDIERWKEKFQKSKEEATRIQGEWTKDTEKVKEELKRSQEEVGSLRVQNSNFKEGLARAAAVIAEYKEELAKKEIERKVLEEMGALSQQTRKRRRAASEDDMEHDADHQMSAVIDAVKEQVSKQMELKMNGVLEEINKQKALRILAEEKFAEAVKQLEVFSEHSSSRQVPPGDRPQSPQASKGQDLVRTQGQYQDPVPLFVESSSVDHGDSQAVPVPDQDLYMDVDAHQEGDDGQSRTQSSDSSLSPTSSHIPSTIVTFSRSDPAGSVLKRSQRAFENEHHDDAHGDENAMVQDGQVQEGEQREQMAESGQGGSNHDSAQLRLSYRAEGTDGHLVPPTVTKQGYHSKDAAEIAEVPSPTQETLEAGEIIDFPQLADPNKSVRGMDPVQQVANRRDWLLSQLSLLDVPRVSPSSVIKAATIQDTASVHEATAGVLKPRQLSISHHDLLYKTEGQWLACRICLKRTRDEAPKKFPTTASWADLIDHCQSVHPLACRAFEKLSPGQIAEMKQRLQK
ncbi:hypothetical protein B0H34DRAFT_199803 [Crassisporium funariophilum]|nr:hypothetical protein B0H34DRAFT_199803 [Crassisporium funariophilum]